MILVIYVFPKLQTAKGVVRQMSKNPRFGTPLESQHVEWSQTSVKSAWHPLYNIFHHSEENWLEKCLY